MQDQVFLLPPLLPIVPAVSTGRGHAKHILHNVGGWAHAEDADSIGYLSSHSGQIETKQSSP